MAGSFVDRSVAFVSVIERPYLDPDVQRAKTNREVESQGPG